MILLIGMLFIKEEETRGTFVSTLYTTSSQNGKRRNQLFHSFWGKESRMSNSTENDNTLYESHREREERIQEREAKHSQDELHEEPDEPKHDKPCERERIRERDTTVSAKREMKMLSDRKAKCI